MRKRKTISRWTPCAVAAAMGCGSVGTASAAPAKAFTGQTNGPTQATVAQDGSGDFKTIQEAINAAPTGTAGHPTLIRVRPGTYKEVVYIQREKRFVRLTGEDPAKTILTYDLSAGVLGPDGKPLGTFRTASTTIDADDFTADNITFQNTAGPVGQALAVRIDGDRVAFHHCRFLGWQDTILDNRGRQYYDRCEVTGAVDFIFGGGTALFDHCDITELRDKGGDVTAPSTPVDVPYGLVFRDCRLTGGPGVLPGSTGLMRPWRAAGESAFLDCTLDASISARGWDPWSGREATCRAEEYGSRTPDGIPIALSTRAPWVHRLTAAEAARYTNARVLGGWEPPPTAVRRRAR